MDIAPAELNTTREAALVPEAKAEEILAVQHRGTEVDIVSQLEEALGNDFAGVWFDSRSGEFVVPVVADGQMGPDLRGQKIAVEFAAAALDAHYRTPSAHYTYGELESAQAAIAERLREYGEPLPFQTAIDPAANTVVLRVPESIDPHTLAVAEKLVNGAAAKVEIATKPDAVFGMKPASCQEQGRYCDRPVRGGQGMFALTGPSETSPMYPQACTAGFRANGLDGRKYVVTAGHCAKYNGTPIWHWLASTASEGNHVIGITSQWHYPGRDWMKIDTTGYWPDVAPWPTILAYWGADHEYPIYAEAKSYKGQTLCHSGMNTGASCGIINEENVSLEYVNGDKLNSLFEMYGANLCLGSGDSGGPMFANHTALGILSGGGPDGCGSHIVFSDILAANAELNVNIVGSGAPEAITGAPTNVKAQWATVSGQLNPRGLPTTYRIEYGTGGFTSSTSELSAGSFQGFSSFTRTISGPLAANTLYKYRVVATNSLGVSYGAEGTFKTGALSPAISSVSAVEGGKTTALLQASIDPRGSGTVYRFEYGPTASYGFQSPEIDIGLMKRNVWREIADVEGPLHYRVVATNLGGTSVTPDGVVNLKERPFVDYKTPAGVSGSSGTLRAAVDPRGMATSIRFEYGLTTGYGATTSEVSVPAGSPADVTQPISGLAPGTPYHYRAVATNWAGPRFGQDRTLETLKPGQYQLAFGSQGSGSGQLSHPADVAVDATGNSWVVDKGNNRLQQFNDKGEFMKAVGGYGATAGKLNSPTGVAIHSDGKIFVSDTENHRVVQFNSKGEFVLAFGRNVNKTKAEQAGPEGPKNVCTAASGNVCQAGVGGSANGQFYWPTGIALTAGGNVMVVDAGNSRVQKVGPEGAYLAKFGSYGSGQAQLKEPTAVAVAPDASIWVADTGNNRLQQWTSTFEWIRQVGSPGSGDGQFNRPTGVEAAADGKIYAGDEGGSRVEVFNAQGSHLGQFGSLGSGPAQFNFATPMGIGFDAKGFLLITDTENERVQRWKAE